MEKLREREGKEEMLQLNHDFQKGKKKSTKKARTSGTVVQATSESQERY